MNTEAISDLKLVPCEKCGGPPNVSGGPLPRRVLYFADRIEVRCNNDLCGDVIVFKKGEQQ